MRCNATSLAVEARGAAIAAPRGPWLELQIVDVLDFEGVRRAEDDLRLPVRALHDLVLAELAGGERLADLSGDLAFGERGDRVAAEVAEILRVPQGELLDGAVVDVLLHLARQAEAGEHDLALV